MAKIKNYVATDERGVWAAFKVMDDAEVFQYRKQHDRWDYAPWWIAAFTGFDPVEAKQMREVADLQAAVDPTTLVEYDDDLWTSMETDWKAGKGDGDG